MATNMNYKLLLFVKLVGSGILHLCTMFGFYRKRSYSHKHELQALLFVIVYKLLILVLTN